MIKGGRLLLFVNGTFGAVSIPGIEVHQGHIRFRPVWGDAEPAWRTAYFSLLIMLARYPAPKPLSMLTTQTPLAQLLSMVSRAESPLKLAP